MCLIKIAESVNIYKTYSYLFQCHVQIVENKPILFYLDLRKNLRGIKLINAVNIFWFNYV